jgi:uncharacterized protein (TIGR02996 family)
MTPTTTDRQAFLDDMIRQLCIANEINPVVLVSPPPFYPIPYPMKIVTTATSDQQALLAAIEVEPDNLTLRLVYADWLDERQAGGRCEPCRGSGYRFCPRCSGEGCSVYGIAANGRCLADDKCDDCSGSGRISNGFAQLACDQRLFVAAQAVIAMPDEDGPRLEYAKIAEAYGRVERAEFTRIQIELWNKPCTQFMYGCHELSRDGRGPCVCKDYGKYDALRWREQELLDKNRKSWFSLDKFKPWANAKDDVCWVTTGGQNNNGYLGGKIRRGFINEVRATLGDWLTHGRAICREHPVREDAGMVTDREPTRTTAGEWYWQREIEGHATENFTCLINEDVFGYLELIYKDHWDQETFRFYPTREAAMITLSRACIKWARGEHR